MYARESFLAASLTWLLIAVIRAIPFLVAGTGATAHPVNALFESVSGIIPGLAFQSTLGSVLAGFVLILSRPFEIGDWARIGDHEGFITEISINHVRLRNPDGEHVVLPNEAVSNRTTINRSEKANSDTPSRPASITTPTRSALKESPVRRSVASTIS